MRPANHIAFKEWAVVCAALSQARQCLILRKGGIHERTGEFHVEHDEFWLFPTYEHELAEALIDEAQPLFQRVVQEKPGTNIIRLASYAVVEDVIAIRDPIVLPSLAGLHIWSHRTIDQRFHYKRPGLMGMIVRVYRASVPIELPNSPHFGGCRSWVELPTALQTTSLGPVMDDATFGRQRAAIQVATSAVRLA